MTETLLYIVVALTVVTIVLLVDLLLRKQEDSSAQEILSRLSSIAQTGHTFLVEARESTCGLESVTKQLRDFSQTTASALVASRQPIEEKLTQTLFDARSGRTEFASSFQVFKGNIGHMCQNIQTKQMSEKK
jgi:DNA recombination protein RmuC